MTADHVAWVVLVVSTFYLLDRLLVWALSRALASYGGRVSGTAGRRASEDPRRAQEHPGGP